MTDVLDIEDQPNLDEEDQIGDLDKTDLDDIGFLHEDALEYIAGYMIKKLNLEKEQCHSNSSTWVDQVSKGSLKKPSSTFLSQVKKMELIFHKINGLEIAHCRNLNKRLVEKSGSIDLPEHVKRFFFKCRIHFRVRNLNHRLKVQKSKQSCVSKKMLKIKL